MYHCLKRNEKEQGKGNDGKSPTVSSQHLTHWIKNLLSDVEISLLRNAIHHICHWKVIQLMLECLYLSTSISALRVIMKLQIIPSVPELCPV
jgi:hypothetical protein